MVIALPRIELKVATPCYVSWNEMKGDERTRYCGQCRQNVHDLSMMSTNEVNELLSQSNGSPCVRFYKRTDGRVITNDCPVGLRTRIWQRIRRRSLWAASLFALFFIPACRSATQGSCDPRNRAEELLQQQDSHENH